MLLMALFVTTMFLAYANGANDNFKGVATLYGSGTASYRVALTMSTIATLAGSISAIFLAQELVNSFSGKGLVPQETVVSIVFLIAVGFGAATTVLSATHLGFPISTTHSLVGGLLGAGLLASGNDVNLSQLGTTFLIPLLVSPLLAFVIALMVYWVFTRLRRVLGLNKESCFCIGERWAFILITTAKYSQAKKDAHSYSIIDPTLYAVDTTVANYAECREIYTTQVWGVYLQTLLDIAHFFSGAMVCFARGLNDTPKIAGLLVAVQLLDIRWGLLAIGVAMGLGGLLNSYRVVETISHKITQLNHGQGFSANLVTSILVIFASKFGVPVSTTHVSIGAIFGIGAITGQGNRALIRDILLSWVITLPIAGLISAMVYWLIS